MQIFTRIYLLLALMSYFAGAAAAQIPTSVYFEAECVDRSGTDYIVGGDVAASNDRYLMAASGSADGPLVPETRIFRYDFDLNVPFVELLDIAVFGRLRATVATQSFLQVRVNGSQWFFFQGSIEPSDTFAWVPAPERLTNLRTGQNTVEIAIMEVGTQLDKLYFTIGNDVPSGMGGAAVNCGNYDFEPNIAPVAVARAEPTSGTAPLTVQLDGSASFDDDGSIVSYDWAWENGGLASGPTPSVTFAAGTYEVTLTVTDDFNATSTDRITVTVEEAVTDGSTSTFWLEAECAEVGADWSFVDTPDASAGQSLVIGGRAPMRSAAPEDTASHIRFTLRDVMAGNYSLFARINAPGPLSDSYWVRINGGEWYAWKSGIRQAVGYRWNRYPGGQFALQGGTNVIDFAFREAGAELDKLHLNQSGTKPAADFGEEATNCADENATSFSLEMECGRLGAGWRVTSSSAASKGAYLQYLGPNGFGEPVDPEAHRTATYTVEVTKAATYFGFLRLDATDLGSNSVWVRVDQGKWIKMWKETDGSALATTGFEWRQLADDGTAISFLLDEGSHTITIVNRESSTRLDKLFLTTEDRLPTGLGRPATNCTPDILPAIAAPSSPVAQSIVVTDDMSVSVYPNPATDLLTLELEAELDGRASVAVYDMTGRQVTLQVFEWSGGHLRQPIDVADLAPGMYQLRVLANDRTVVRPFVKR